MHKLFKHTVFIGKKAFFLPSCHSTNEISSMLVGKGEQLNGTVIYTDFQSSGKGQRGNRWESESGKNILLSIILETKFVEPSDFFNLTISASLAIQDLLSDYIKEGIKIKWPNDIMYGNQKLCGILIENYIKQNVIEWCIVGVGLNINQVIFEEQNAISLAKICGQQFEREELINLLLLNIEKRYLQLRNGQVDTLRKEYLSNLYWKNEVHVFQSEGAYFNGKITGVESSGKLIMEVEDGMRFFDFKEVKFIK